MNGYVLAGGLSSRMGRNKGELELGGRSLLDHALGKLLPICEKVSVVGPADGPAEGARFIRDLRSGCGPLGGIEAALSDTKEGWAAFLPLDMPFLPGGLLRHLASVARAPAGVCRAGYFTVDGRAQPLVSVLHTAFLPSISRFLDEGVYKVRPALDRAAADLAAEAGHPESEVLTVMEVALTPTAALATGWRPTTAEWAQRHLWFSNLNTPDEFSTARAAWSESPFR